jgi:hypothetical protein
MGISGMRMTDIPPAAPAASAVRSAYLPSVHPQSPGGDSRQFSGAGRGHLSQPHSSAKPESDMGLPDVIVDRYRHPVTLTPFLNSRGGAILSELSLPSTARASIRFLHVFYDAPAISLPPSLTLPIVLTAKGFGPVRHPSRIVPPRDKIPRVLHLVLVSPMSPLKPSRPPLDLHPYCAMCCPHCCPYNTI